MIDELSVNVEYIEMIGLSGAGKTTIFQNHEIMNVDFSKNNKIAFPIVPKRWCHYMFVLLIMVTLAKKTLSGFSGIVISKKKMKLISKLGYRLAGYKMRNYKGFVFLKDSGILMPFISSVIDDQLEWQEMPLDELLGILPLPKHVYFVDTDFNTAFRRFVSREEKKYAKQSTCSISDFSNAQKFINYLIPFLKQNNIDVCVLNNTNHQNDSK